ncbi:ATP-binding protein [Planobispora rosea]|nr:ATP-binding protein [Planobispora rosea]
MSPLRCRLRLPAALPSLEQLADHVLSLARRARLPKEATYRLRLATDELATNIIVHGYAGRGGEFAVCCGTSGESVWVRLEDDAPPFDPRRGLSDPELDVPPAERRIGGLGIFLALRALDDFAYMFVDGVNTSTLMVHRHVKAE